MPKKIMERKAADNKYLHRDFHISMSMALDYVLNRYGKEGVIEYLTLYSNEYLSPLKRQLKEVNIKALEQYFIDIYKIEESSVKTEILDDSLSVKIEKCPGIKHIKEKGEKVSIAWIETTTTVYKVLCEDTPYEFQLIDFDKENGKSNFIFKRRAI